jgi:hypothetical protein
MRMIESQLWCHEAFVGSGKNHFLRGNYDKAMEYFGNILRLKKDDIYIVWMGCCVFVTNYTI